MKLQSTIQALRERCPSFNRHIYGICEWANLPAKINPAEQPSAYVFTLSEDADTANVSKNSYHQDIGTTVAVVVAVPSKDIRGQTASDIFEDLKDEIFKADEEPAYEYLINLPVTIGKEVTKKELELIVSVK